jgi:hypothetical protein
MLQDILRQMSSSGDKLMANDSLADVMGKAALISKAITAAQKEQRSEPYEDSLRSIGSSFAQADAKRRTQLNQNANEVRSDYIDAGNSPIGLDKSLWGNDPSQGFQTGKSYLPGYYGDNMSQGTKERLAPITGMYEGRNTFGALMDSLGAETQQANAETSRLTQQNNARHNAFLEGQDTLANNQGVATNSAIGEIMTFGSPEEVFAYLSKPLPDNPGMTIRDAWVNDGVDMNKVLSAISLKWYDQFKGTPPEDSNALLDSFGLGGNVPGK